MKARTSLPCFLLMILVFGFSCSKQVEPWILFETNDGEFGYMTFAGDTMIRSGKYSMCFSDTFETMAIVFDNDHGIIGINRAEEILFNVFSFDNGPDYVSEGLFRIVDGDKMGFANVKGVVVIKPEYSCAFPYQNGKARVSLNCIKNNEGEHSSWESERWFYIDKNGQIIE